MTTQYILPVGKTQFFYDNGSPLANGTVGMYLPNTLTPKDTYSDLSGSTLNINPVPLDANGRAVICGTGNYRQIVKDVNGTTIWDKEVSDGGITAFALSIAASAGASLIGWLSSAAGAVAATISAWLDWQDLNIFVFLTTAEIMDVLAFGYTYDLTTKIYTAYAAAAAAKKRLIFPGGGYRFIATLTFDQSVDIIGRNSEFVIFMKDSAAGDFDGITIGGAAQQSTFQNFRLTSTGAVSTGVGIKVLGSARMLMERVQVDHMGSHGFWFYDSAITGRGVFSNYRNLVSNNNGGDGIRVEKHYASYWENLNLNGNTGWGFNLVEGNSHVGKAIICESNVAGGAQIDLAVANSLEIYGESNTGTDMSLTANSTRNEALMYHSGGVSDVSDEGTNNVIREIGTFPMISSPTFSRIPRTANVAGRDVSFSAGRAGPGAVGHAGGNTHVRGGDAGGGTAANGGNLYLDGGQDVVGGAMGSIYIGSGTPDAGGTRGGVVVDGVGIVINSDTQPLTLNNTGDGGIRINRTDPVGVSVGLDMQGVTRVLKLNSITNADEAALTPERGMIIYNQTTGKLNFYNDLTSAWEVVTSV